MKPKPKSPPKPPARALLLTAPLPPLSEPGPLTLPIHVGLLVARAAAQRPEEEWPAPTPAELARVAAAFPHGTDAERAARAVALTWECASAQRAAVESVRAMRDRDTRAGQRDADLWRVLKMKPEDFPLSHREFLARLNTEPLQARRGLTLRGRELWMFFVRYELLTNRIAFTDEDNVTTFRALVSERKAAEWDAMRETEGWPLGRAGWALQVARSFAAWRAGVKSTRKREAAQTGKKALDGARFKRREKKSAR